MLAGKATVVPPAIGKQIVKLAIPVLIAKSLVYIAAGILLFTTFAPAVITIGLGIYFFSLGHAYIRGAFSLKNEKLSYFWYVMLGLGIIAFGLFSEAVRYVVRARNSLPSVETEGISIAGRTQLHLRYARIDSYYPQAARVYQGASR